MNKKILSFAFLVSLFSAPVFSQVAMGNWRIHLAYNSVTQIAQSENKVFGVSDGSLYSVDKQDAGMELYSKVSGLNGSTISRIKFDPISKQLLIIYSNGNIDLLTSGGVVNIPDLYNKQMNSSKDVNHITFYQNKAYLSCNFGIIVLNMQKKEIADTYYIGANASEVKVTNVTIHDGMIYAISPTAIYQASVTEPSLVNYEFWSTMGSLPGSGDFQSAGSFADKLFILRGGKLYMKDGSNWSPFLAGINASYFDISNDRMLVNDGSDALYVVDESLNYKTMKGVGSIPDAEYDKDNNTFWLAANAAGIASYKESGSDTPEISYFKPTGPAVNAPWDMTFAGKKLFVIQGGKTPERIGLDGMIMIYENDKWTVISRKNIQDSTKHDALDFTNISVNPNDNSHFFATSFGTGLYEFRNNTLFKWHTPFNSTLTPVIQGYSPYYYTRSTGAAFDQQNNLFVINTDENQRKTWEIRILHTDGTWSKLSYVFPYIDQTVLPTMGKLLISNQSPNQKWSTSLRYSPGVCVFDDNGTLTDQSDDKSIFFKEMIYPETDTSGKTILESVIPGLVYSLAQDKNGVIWIGTEKGPFLFQNLTKVFEPGYTCSRVKIPRNDSTNLADYLLEKEKIKAIAIDGANRKWLGTESSGVYLMSENGQETIKHFTSSNSPLLSNDILSIAINPVTGEVFFGTSMGLVSYQSDAAEAGSSFSNVYAYPNPVREGFNGIITITGLVENTQVKITDISGNLICQTVSNGSIATWDGKDMHGRKVSTGVYLAMCTSPDGSQNTITKILVIN